MEKHAIIKRTPWRGEESQRAYTTNLIAAAARCWRQSLRDFATWLEQDRGLALSTITLRVASARAFVQAHDDTGGVCTLRRLGATDIEDSFVHYAKEHGPAATRSTQAAMRLFLHFARERGWLKHGLADAVPSMRSYRLSQVPRGLSKEGVRVLRGAGAKESARDHTIVLLLILYGIRRGHVCALQLDDIDWRSRLITFRAHKGGKPIQHVLAPEVAAPLSTYLRHGRPRLDQQAVFLRTSAPHLPLGPSAVTAVVHRMMKKWDLMCTPRGPHALRHAFATRLLQDGQSLKVIADLLGHQSLAEVSTYAKLDHPRLLKIAALWPEVTP